MDSGTMCRTVGAKFSVAFRAENQYRTGQPFTYIFCNASYTKHITATPDLRDANALSISSGSGTQSLAGMDPKCPPQRRRNLVAHLRTLLCDVVPGGACPAAALVAVRWCQVVHVPQRQTRIPFPQSPVSL